MFTTVNKRSVSNSSIAYQMSIGQIPGVISSPSSIFGGNNNSISSPNAANPPTKFTAVTQGQQLQNVQASVTELPSTSDKQKAAVGIFGVIVISALVFLVLK
jgi:hypothetical protein